MEKYYILSSFVNYSYVCEFQKLFIEKFLFEKISKHPVNFQIRVVKILKIFVNFQSLSCNFGSNFFFFFVSLQKIVVDRITNNVCKFQKLFFWKLINASVKLQNVLEK